MSLFGKIYMYMTIKHSLNAKTNERIYNITEDKLIKAHKRTLISNRVLMKKLHINLRLNRQKTAFLKVKNTK